VPLRIVPDSAALFLEEGRVLVISDLHLGYERKLEAKGVHVPEQTGLLIGKVKVIASSLGAEKLVVLGDVKQEIASSSLYTTLSVSSFFRGLEGSFAEIFVVPGNHDGNLASIIPPFVHFVGVGGLLLRTSDGGVGLFHGHAHPSPAVGKAKTLVSGHLHFTLARHEGARGLWVRATFGPREEERTLIVMPAFNPLLGGVPVNGLSLGRRNPVLATILGPDAKLEAFLQDGTNLGSLEALVGRLEMEAD
jgi:putative SbcD/Mre11-related phosphoesterase